MTARQTIIQVRGGRTDLSAEVASLLPSEMARAHKSIRRESHSWTTFCPVCGGDKDKTAARCRDCYDNAVKATHHRSSGARALVGQAIVREQPNHGDPKTDGPTWSRRAKGDGVARRQPWERKVLVNGRWMLESETPEGKERRASADDALRRLQGVRP